MTAELLKGKDIAQALQEKLKGEVAEIKVRYKTTPKLVALKASTEHGSEVYLRSQQKTAELLGINYEVIGLDPSKGEAYFIKALQELNQSPSVHGVIIQLPLPEGWNADKIQGLLNPQKDVEGVSPQNLGLLLLKKEVVVPCTALAVMEILKYTKEPLYGKEIAIVGSSFIVGRPVALLLMKERATVHVLGSASSKNKTLEGHIRKADIVIACAGEANLIKGDWIKEGAIVIDVGINELNGKTVGDVEFEAAAKKAQFITPVPGGVGPLTATILMENLIKAFLWQRSK